MSGVVRCPDIESDDEEVLWYEQDLLKILSNIAVQINTFALYYYYY